MSPVVEGNLAPRALECANHPGRETSLRCGRCGKPICVKCIIQTPVGARCRECAQVRALPVYQADAPTVARAAIVGLLVATLGFVLLFSSFRGFSLWLSPLVGIAVGEAISLSTNRKRAVALQSTAAVAVVVGALLADILPLYLRLGGINISLVLRLLVADVVTLTIVSLFGAILAISRLR